MIILTHIGNTLPDYLETFIIQLKKFNDTKIVFLVNNSNVNKEIFLNNGIDTYPIEELDTDLVRSFILKFGHGDLGSHLRNIEYGGTDYWCVTATRLFYIYEYARKFNINEYFHFENDVMLYCDVDEILKDIKNNGNYDGKILITRGTINKIMTGFVWVGNNEMMNHLLNEMNTYIMNKNDLFQYGIDMINEMSLLHIYQKLNPDKMINLPILDSGLFSSGIEFFNSIFDPATYGQFIDGIPSSPGVSLITESYIGDAIRSTPEIRIEFISVDEKRIPFLVNGGNKTKINNLHIHSKRLNLFLS